MKKIIPDNDGQALTAVVRALAQGYGRGGLTYIANKLGMTPSAMRKRLTSKAGAFDGLTMRAVLLVTSSKAELCKTKPTRETRVGDYTIEIHEGAPKWRRKSK